MFYSLNLVSWKPYLSEKIRRVRFSKKRLRLLVDWGKTKSSISNDDTNKQDNAVSNLTVATQQMSGKN